MTNPPASFGELSLADRDLIDAACGDFESAIRNGTSHSIPTILETVPEALRSILLTELVRLECEAKGRVAEERHPSLDTLGPYVLCRELGRGGFGSVYAATDTRDGKTYALKIPLDAAKAHPDFPERFRRETIAIARLNHPNLVRVHEVGGGDPDWFIAAEYVAGPSLAAWIDEYQSRGESIPISIAARILTGVADGVQHAHEGGVIHRDLKPANILLKRSSLVPKVTDFGHARMAEGDGAISVSGQVIGTPAYMAPEQASGRSGMISVRTDVYALGAVLYELLTGRPPFSAESPMEVLVQILTVDPPSPIELRHELPRDLVAVCLRCLEKDPARRYDSAGAVSDELRRHLSGQRTLTRPPGVLAHSIRWVRRHKIASVLLAAVVVFFVSAFAGLFVHNRRLGQANQDLTNAISERDSTNRKLRRIAYAAGIRKANALLNGGELVAAVQTLDEWVALPGEEDLRGWEWHYLKNQIDRGCVAQWKPGVMHSLAYSPDGRGLAGAGEDGFVHLWDPETGRDLKPPIKVGGSVKPLIWESYGKWLAVGDSLGVVTVWSPNDGRKRVLWGHKETVTSLTVSPDGRTLASASKDGTVLLWDMATDESVSKLVCRYPQGVRAIGYTPDGIALIVSRENGARAEIVEARPEGKTLGTLADDLSKTLVTVRTISDRSRFLTVGRLGVLAWGWSGVGAQAKLLLKIPDRDMRIPNQESRINDAAMSIDGKTLAVAYDTGVTIWDSSECELRGHLRGHEGRVWSVAVHPNNGRIVTSGADGIIKVWDITQGPMKPSRLTIPSKPSAGEGWVFDQLPFAIFSRVSQTPEIWDWKTDSCWRVTFKSASIHRVRRFSNEAFVEIDGHGQVIRWDTPSGKVAPGGGASFAPTRMFRATADNTPASEPNANCLALDPNRRRIAACWPNDIFVWNMAESRTTTVLSSHHRLKTSAMAFAPDGNRLASGGNDGICVWDLGNGELEIPLIEIRGTVDSLAFHPSGAVLASGGMGGMIRLWDGTGKLLKQWHGHASTVRSLSFSPNGRTLASASDDGTIRIWLAETGDELLTLTGSGGPQIYVSFNGDGRYLFGDENNLFSGRILIRMYDSSTQ